MKNENIFAAEVYAPADDLFIISTYYNPRNFKTRKDNVEVFINKLIQSKMNWMIVECAFQDQVFQLPESGNFLRFRGSDVLWQKERLLNLALKKIPERFTNIAWVDNDILFENPKWAVQSSELLKTFAVVQPFEKMTMLSSGQNHYSGTDDIYTSFASVYSKDSQNLLSGVFETHGHTGFAWAARRDIFEKHGFYDCFIAGGADEVMAHAFCGDWTSPCMKKSTGGNIPLERHVVPWCEKIYAKVQSNVGCLGGNALHLWHGKIEDRQYLSRGQNLTALGFDPKRDLVLSKTGLWEFSPQRDDLRQWSVNYFKNRKEDG